MKFNIEKTEENLKKVLKKITIKGIATGMGVIVSMIALGVSYEGYKLSSEQYNNSQIAIYRADLDKDKETLILKPYSDKIYLQLANVYFPTKLTEDSQPFKVNNGDYKLYLTLLVSKLQEILKQEITINKGDVGVCQLSVPLIISSNYIYNGNIYWGRGHYAMLIDATINDIGTVTINLKSIVYVGEVAPNSKPNEILDSEWEQYLNDFKKQNWEQ